MLELRLRGYLLSPAGTRAVRGGGARPAPAAAQTPALLSAQRGPQAREPPPAVTLRAAQRAGKQTGVNNGCENVTFIVCSLYTKHHSA